jgi:adenylate kinase
MVDSVVFLGCSEGLASSRMKSLPASAVRPNHNDEEGFARRWARWQAIDAANGQGADAALAQQHNIHNPLFFVQESVEVLELPEGVAADTERGLDTVLAYVSKKGRPANYHPTEEEESAAKAAEQTKREEQERAAKEDARAKAQDESAQRARAATNASLRRAAVLLEDAALVEASAAPMRTYLLDNVIPALVDGLLDVAKNQPEDPVDALAEYLFNYSVDVPADKDNAQDRPKL